MVARSPSNAGPLKNTYTHCSMKPVSKQQTAPSSHVFVRLFRCFVFCYRHSGFLLLESREEEKSTPINKNGFPTSMVSQDLVCRFQSARLNMLDALFVALPHVRGSCCHLSVARRRATEPEREGCRRGLIRKPSC